MPKSNSGFPEKNGKPVFNISDQNLPTVCAFAALEFDWIIQGKKEVQEISKDKSSGRNPEKENSWSLIKTGHRHVARPGGIFISDVGRVKCKIFCISEPRSYYRSIPRGSAARKDERSEYQRNTSGLAPRNLYI